MPHIRIVPPPSRGGGGANPDPPAVAMDDNAQCNDSFAKQLSAVPDLGTEEQRNPSSSGEPSEIRKESSSRRNRASAAEAAGAFMIGNLTRGVSNVKGLITGTHKQRQHVAFQPYVNEVELELESTLPATVIARMDRTGQHTLSWQQPIYENAGDAEPALPVGMCNLYLYPSIRTALEPRGYRTGPAGLRVLRRMLIALATTTHELNEPDEVGAFAIHALVVCNTPESLDLSMELFELQPALMSQLHVKHRAGFPLFTGESSLHILAVNKHEDLLCRLIQLARQKLSPSDLADLIRSQTGGVFFHSQPMIYYGGTVLSYVCVFEMRQAIVDLLSTGVLSFNSRPDGCVNSGFMPLHAVVANGSIEMYDFITEALPHEWRADPHQVTKKGMTAKAKHLRALTSMQLAAKLGDHKCFRHILRKQCEIEWVWGPVTQFSLNLKGIDSGGEGGGDIMELVTRMDAARGTQEMLLDSFMNGFIYRLFTQKWTKYGRKLYYARLSLDALLLGLLLVLSVHLKTAIVQDTLTKVLCAAMIGVMIVIVEEEVRTAILFARNEQGVGDARLSIREYVVLAWEFTKLHAVQVQVMGMAATLFVIVTLLSVDLDHPSDSLPYGVNGSLSLPTSRRQMKGLSIASSDNGKIYVDASIFDQGGWGSIWIFLTLAQMLLMVHFAIVGFKPFESLHVLLLSIFNMLRDDVATYLVAYAWTLVVFFFALWTLYPRAGEDLFPVAEQFNSPISAIQAIIQLSLIGEPFQIYSSMLVPLSKHMSWTMTLSLGLWILLYLFFIIMTLILLVNLLIAMLTHTFETVREEATLQSRLSFAQCIIKQELVAESWGMATQVGEIKPDGRYVFTFRSVLHDRDDESEDGYAGDLDEGGADPFQDPTPTGTARIERSLAEMQETLLANHAKILARLYPEQEANPVHAVELKSLMRVVVDKPRTGESAAAKDEVESVLEETSVVHF